MIRALLIALALAALSVATRAQPAREPCGPGTRTCIDVLVKAPDFGTEMPLCVGRWLPLPEPLPPRKYGMVFTAKVTAKGAPEFTVRDATGRVIATLHYPDVRNWECDERAPEKAPQS